MHLNKLPTWFVKDGERRPVYYTVDARELSEEGWEPEEEVKEHEISVTGVAIPITSPQPAEEVEEDLTQMTKAELVDYAKAYNIEIDPGALKSVILEACLEAQSNE